jgi:hypothetical protein
MNKRYLMLVAATIASLWGGAAQAQNCLGGADFDACMAATLGAQQSANNAAMQQTWQNYLQAYGPMLEQQYEHSPYRNQETFEQFAYYMLMTANGTNIQGGIDAQRRQFEGNQIAHGTVEGGNNDYNAGSAYNSQATDQAIGQFDQGAIRGNVGVVDPQTGQTEYVPYSSIQDNQPFAYNGGYWVHANGGYYQWNGNGWAPAQ